MSDFRDPVRVLLYRCCKSDWATARLRDLTRRGLVPAAFYMRLPVDRPFDVSVPGSMSFSYHSTRYDQIGRLLFWRGVFGYEPETARVFFNLAKTADVVLDIGAHTGFYSLLTCVSNPMCSVFAFEPVPRIAQLLRRNISANGLRERCTVVEAAVSDKSGTGEIYVPQTELPVAAALGAKGACDGHEAMPVDVVAIDSCIPSHTPVSLVKIDAEGHEIRVLHGMAKTILRNQPAIILECLETSPNNKVETYLRRFGYRFYHLLDTGPVETENLLADPARRHRNFLCLPESHGEPQA